jgi:hypothetical protein
VKWRRTTMAIVASLFALAWCAWLAWADWAGDRSEMYARYDQVQIGSPLSEVEARIGMSSGPIEYDHTNVPQLVMGEDAYSIKGSDTNYYSGRRYILVLQYVEFWYDGKPEVKHKVVTGKGLLRTSRSTQRVERLAQGYWD